MLQKLWEIVYESKLEVEEILKTAKEGQVLQAHLIHGKIESFNDYNLLYHGDNISAIVDLLKRGYKGKLDLIYIDPPFYTMNDYIKRVELEFNGERKVIEYKAYSDIWNSFEEYLKMLSIRLIMMKELMSSRGSIYLHVDFRTVHYLKVIMDEIFGVDNFINEIIWSYKSGGTSNRYFSRKHDSILFYSKTKDYIFNPVKEKSYNRKYKPYRFKGVEEFQDELGWYTMVNSKDVWQIDMVGRTSKERVGYETQKPEKLLEKIILASSNENSIVGDFFSGSGTTLSVAHRLCRQWIGSDMSNSSLLTIKKRMSYTNYLEFNFGNYENFGDLILETNKTLNNNTSAFKLALKEYKPNMESLKFTKKNRILVEEILYKDSLVLVDYIAIIRLKDNFLIYEDFITRDKTRIDTDFEIHFNDENLGLIVIDIFGNKIFKKLKLLVNINK